MKAKLSLRVFAGALALSALPNLCVAQTRARVTITHLKPDMATDWVDLQKNEVVPALKKAGVKTRTVYQTAFFGNSFEYVQVQPFDSTAEFDGQNPLVKALDATAAARLTTKLNKCIEAQNSYQITRFNELDNALDPPAPIIVTVRYRIAAGKMQEYRDLMKSEILPVYKKSKNMLQVAQRGPGGNPTDVTVVTGYQKFADMNGGPFLAQQLGQAGADKVNAKFAAIRTTIEVVTRRRVPDLSF
jgi:hypothetical protein